MSLDVVEAMALWFYRDGVYLGSVSVKDGIEAGGVGLSLISIPGTDDANIYMTATSQWAFDEVCLVDAGGVGLDVGNTVLVKYAFVGSPKQTRNGEGLESGIARHPFPAACRSDRTSYEQ